MCTGTFRPGIGSPAMAAETKTRLSQTTGDECPSPGVAVFHSPFVSGSKWTGRPVSVETPSAAGPRQAGQLANQFAGADGVSAAAAPEADCPPKAGAGGARTRAPAMRAAPDSPGRRSVRTVAPYSVR